MVAILMTSLLGPDAELRWANWLKLLQIPQSSILCRSPKIVTKFTRDHFFGPFDIDYVFQKSFVDKMAIILIISRYIVINKIKSLRYFQIFVSIRAYVSHLVKYFKPTLEIIIASTVAL